MKLRGFLVLLVVLLISVTAMAEIPEIAVVVKITGIPWFNRLEEGVIRAAEELNVNAYQVGPTDADPAQQVKIVEDLIAKGVDAICVVPNDANAMEPVLKKAREKGIIVLTHESPDQQNADWDIEVIDNVAFGEKNFETLAEGMGGEGQFAVFVGSLTVPLHNLWADIGLAMIEEKYPNMELVTERIPCGEDVNLSKQKTQELLRKYPELKGIVGFGSLGPIGAAQALKEKRLTDKVTVVGTVLPGHAAQYLAQGYIDTGYLWDPADAGFALVYVADMMFNGETVETGMVVPGLGEAEVDETAKVIKFNSILDITAENAAELGF
ncbi:MAG TPA: autoinducer 2 ABC transporter substrate-binding protein [Thermotogota bacterium]|nr:autoinducer 2 ABC transporter substrate-binding protein [Thermotogota bacterium]HPJ88294.1 autoinducer 2 ABC transporter substrate-binding protein [Thermotogota bacterium]HPR95359.1 autoinducer 2 ABC transporter substrate-binding protein [Thermotogota bacterium]